MKRSSNRPDAILVKEINEIEYKRCSSCLKWKPLNSKYFWKNKNGVFGYINECNDCRKDNIKSKHKNFFEKKIDNIIYKRCSVCENYLPKTSEYFSIRIGVSYDACASQCKKCIVKLSKERKEKDSFSFILYSIYRSVLTRANKVGYKDDVDFDIEYLEESYFKQNGLCAISGFPMTHIVNNGRIKTNISIDRIDSSVGYFKNNIQLVREIVNRMKSDQSEEEFITLCNAIVDYNR